MRKAAEAEVARLREELAEAKASGEGAREFREAREILRAAGMPDAPTLLASAVAEGLLRPDQVMLQYLCDVAWNVHIKTTENCRWSPAVKRLLLSVPPGGPGKAAALARQSVRGVSLQCLIQMVANCDGRALYIYERCGGDLDVVDSTVSTWGVENEFSELEIVSRKGRLKNILPVLLDVDKALQLKRMGAKERGLGVAEPGREAHLRPRLPQGPQAGVGCARVCVYFDCVGDGRG
mmetsp:Transcript_38515/g.122085  ORF Transcript_38515/g.122085 Transcript_38515/m.122085 type:complete len:236 (-) Transcript_38515:10-717(-)